MQAGGFLNSETNSKRPKALKPQLFCGWVQCTATCCTHISHRVPETHSKRLRFRNRRNSVVGSKAPQHASPAQPSPAHETQGKRLRFRNQSNTVAGSKAPQHASPTQPSPAQETQGKRLWFRNRSYCAAGPKPHSLPRHAAQTVPETHGKRLRFRNLSYSLVGSKAAQSAPPTQPGGFLRLTARGPRL